MLNRLITSTVIDHASRCCLPGTLLDRLFRSLFRSTTQLLDPVAEACASRSFCAHSSQHTSTVLPPIVTLTEFASSSQSQAAQVFSTMTSSLNTRDPGETSRPCGGREALSESLAI